VLAAAPEPAAAQSCSAPYLVTQTFSSGGKQTEWMLCWQTPATYGLAITSAHFRTAAGKPWVRVFWDARVSEIFVPYHSGNPRYYDLSGFSFPLMTLTAADCPAAAGGTLLGSPAKVCKEVRGRGLAWKNSDGSVYRGQEVVLWSALQAGNYVYIFRWTFRDDGVVLGEVGATGTNLPGKPTEAHMHNASWRLDIDMNGAGNDNVQRVTHTETAAGAGAASDAMAAIATEQGLAWDDLGFTHLHLYDSVLKNARGHNSGYMLMPIRTGTARHFAAGPPNEAWTRNDFWVTRYNAAEMRPSGLPGYVAGGQSVANTDVVLWYWGSAHHMYRDEDGHVQDGYFEGTAQAMFTGFMLKPHNLFDSPPFFP
jgi:primary-amine oxidase